MLGIHCFFSQPVQQGRDVSGVYKTYIPGKIFSNYALYTMLLSALQWKKTNGNIKLYCDASVYEQLRQFRLLSCWDDIEVLRDDSVDRGINLQVFWSAVKFLVYERQYEPFVCIDTDLIVWKKLDICPDVDWQFAHWESSQGTFLILIPLPCQSLQVIYFLNWHLRKRVYQICALQYSITWISVEFSLMKPSSICVVIRWIPYPVCMQLLKYCIWSNGFLFCFPSDMGILVVLFLMQPGLLNSSGLYQMTRNMVAGHLTDLTIECSLPIFGFIRNGWRNILWLSLNWNSSCYTNLLLGFRKNRWICCNLLNNCYDKCSTNLF